MVKKIRFSFILFLIISLVVIIPFQISLVVAQTDSSTVGAGISRPDIRGNEDGSIDATKENIVNTCGLIPTPTAKDSLILSIVTLCLPGVLEKVMEWKEIKCEMAVCSYEAVKNNLDPTFCKKQASYKTCKYVMGEIFAIPPLSALDHIRDLMAQIIANPVGILFGSGISYVRNQITVMCAPSSPNCNVAENPVLSSGVYFLIFVDTVSVYQTLMDMFENGFGNLFGFGSDSKCNELSKIRDDIEGLVENG